MSRSRRLIPYAGLVLLVMTWIARPARAQSDVVPSPGPADGAPVVAEAIPPADDLAPLDPAGAEPTGGESVPPDQAGGAFSPGEPGSLAVPMSVGSEPGAIPPPPGLIEAPGAPPAAVTSTNAPGDDGVIPAQSPPPVAAPPNLPAPAPQEAGAPPPATAQPEPAQPAPAEPAPAAPQPAPATAGAPFAVPAERLPVGPQAVGLTVQVTAPPTMNLHRPATVVLTVKNSGTSDALDVVVRDQLPEGVKFLDAQPAPVGPPVGGLLTWSLGDLPVGAERKLTVQVEPTANGDQDHAATVHVVTGSRARTIVQEPKLRVEQTVSRGPILKGQQVRFDITVTNIGTGPARDVMIRADLSDGLRHDPQGRILELVLAELERFGRRDLRPNETIALPPLIVETEAGGEQTCTIRALSPDVVEGAPEAQSISSITIVEPKLAVSITGPERRYTALDADYVLTVNNPGTAPAQEVRVTATLIGDASPHPSHRGTWDATRRSITWTIPQLEPGKTQTYPFRVRLGGVGYFKVNGEALARGALQAHGSFSTSVEGSALVELTASEELRLLDIGQETIFKLRVRNIGTKEARNVKVRAQLTDTLKAMETSGTEQNAGVDAQNTVHFPPIPQLAAGTEMTLQIRAQAVKDGLATCRAFLIHEDTQYEIESVANATVLGSSAARR